MRGWCESVRGGKRILLGTEWGAKATAHLNAEMKNAGATYAELVKRLNKHGFKEADASLTMELKRGAFAASFFLACLAALELEGVALADV